jgi:hypothetical protein
MRWVVVNVGRYVLGFCTRDGPGLAPMHSASIFWGKRRLSATCIELEGTEQQTPGTAEGHLGLSWLVDHKTPS